MNAHVIDTALAAAMDLTNSACGWVVAPRDGGFFVVACNGNTVAPNGSVVRLESTAALCIITSMPSARRPNVGDTSAQGAAGHAGIPASLLSVPCVVDGDGTVGALELAERIGGPYSIDDVEIASSLASIVGAALVSIDALVDEPVPLPHELGGALQRLYASDRRRYAQVARTVGTLLGAV